MGKRDINEFNESRTLHEGHSISIKEALKDIDMNEIYGKQKQFEVDKIILMINKIHRKKNYIELLRDPRWQRKRLEILERDNFTCVNCGDSESNLQVHHKYYKKDKYPWDYVNSALITLCEGCHDKLSKK